MVEAIPTTRAHTPGLRGTDRKKRLNCKSNIERGSNADAVWWQIGGWGEEKIDFRIRREGLISQG